MAKQLLIEVPMRLSVKTHSQTEMIDVTAQVQQQVTESGMNSGLCPLCASLQNRV